MTTSCVSRGRFLAAASVAATVLAAACGTSEVSVTSPTTSKCQVTVANSMGQVPAAGASGTLSVETNRDCTWSALSKAAWVTGLSPENGQGSATVTYRVAANVEPSPRHGTVNVNDFTIDIAQDPAPCRFTVSPTAAGIPSGGGSASIRIDASSAACSWSATSQAGWLRVSVQRGTGSGSIAVSADANGGEARSGTINVADAIITVGQESTSAPGTPVPPAPGQCSYTVQPLAQTVAAAAGSGTVGVSAGSTCTWTAQSNANWITVTGGGSGTGNGTVAFSFTANSGASRSGTIAIAGSTFTLTQGAVACNYSISADSQAVVAQGGNVQVGVTAGSPCSWSAASNVPWITVAAGGSGTGNGSVTLSVAGNAGAARSGTATIAGRTFTVNQAAAPCTYAIAPESQNVAAGGGGGTVAITAGGGCNWTAAADAPWITITSAAAGSGNGQVAFTVAANSGAARTGTMTIAGRTFTVTQDAVACSFSIAPAGQNVTGGGGSGSVAVIAGAGCAWTAMSNADWITISGAAGGTGNGSVTFTAASNPGGQRMGTLTVAGQTFTVTQDAAPCAYSIAPPGQSFTATGGSGSVSVTTGAGCAWSAVSNADWLTIAAGASGSGNGAVTFNAAANPGPERTGTLTVAGQTFTVTQTAP